jgi:predicted acetyltransferase
VTVTLSRGSPADEQAVRHLFYGFFLELSAWDPGILVNDVGLPVWHESPSPGPRSLDEAVTANWWIRDRCDRIAFREGAAAFGFATVDDASSFKPTDVDAVLLDFYVAPKARGRGFGRAAAELVLRERPGYWLLYVLDGNEPALAFWHSVLAGVADGVEESHGETSTALRFNVG